MTSRVGAASVAFVFAVTSGITAMEVHQLAVHDGGPAVGPVSAPTPLAAAGGLAGEPHVHDAAPGHAHEALTVGAERGVRAPDASAHVARGHATDHGGEGTAADEEASHSGHSGHSGHSEHESTDCTCVGPCASGAPPTLTEPTFAEMWHGAPEPVLVVAAPVDPVHQDPRSYLLPFSNAPPARV